MTFPIKSSVIYSEDRAIEKAGHLRVSRHRFKVNKEHYLSLTEELRSRLEEVKQGSPKHMREKHETRGKLFV